MLKDHNNYLVVVVMMTFFETEVNEFEQDPPVACISYHMPHIRKTMGPGLETYKDIMIYIFFAYIHILYTP